MVVIVVEVASSWVKPHIFHLQEEMVGQVSTFYIIVLKQAAWKSSNCL